MSVRLGDESCRESGRASGRDPRPCVWPPWLRSPWLRSPWLRSPWLRSEPPRGLPCGPGWRLLDAAPGPPVNLRSRSGPPASRDRPGAPSRDGAPSRKGALPGPREGPRLPCGLDDGSDGGRPEPPGPRECGGFMMEPPIDASASSAQLYQPNTRLAGCFVDKRPCLAIVRRGPRVFAT